VARVELPAGSALRVRYLAEELGITYQLPLQQAYFQIWLTAPGEELDRREPELDGIARSFRLKEG